MNREKTERKQMQHIKEQMTPEWPNVHYNNDPEDEKLQHPQTT
jgi:hypothetical protein